MSLEKILMNRLKRLCALESGHASFDEVLTERERRHAIHAIRQMLPAAILQHHECMLRQKRPSIVPIFKGACSYCGCRFSPDSLRRLQQNHALEVCDDCGVLLYLPEVAATAGGSRKRTPARRRK